MTSPLFVSRLRQIRDEMVETAEWWEREMTHYPNDPLMRMVCSGRASTHRNDAAQITMLLSDFDIDDGEGVTD